MNVNLTFGFTDQASDFTKEIAFHVNNVRIVFDLDWKRTFYLNDYVYSDKNVFFIRLIDYDFCTCETALDTEKTNIPVAEASVKNLAEGFPMKILLDQAVWHYRPIVRLPFKFTPSVSQIISSVVIPLEGFVQIKSKPILQWRNVAPYLMLKDLTLPSQLNDGYQPASE